MKEIRCSLPQPQFFPHFTQLNSISFWPQKISDWVFPHCWASLLRITERGCWKCRMETRHRVDSRRNREFCGEHMGQWGKLRELKSRPHVSALKRSVMRLGVKTGLRGNMLVPLFYCSQKKLPRMQWLKKHRCIVIQFCRLTSPTQTMPG